MKESDFKTKMSSSEEDVISFYDLYAKSWDDRFNKSLATEYFLKKRYESFITVLHQCEVPHGCAVELGVGTGVYVPQISKMFKDIIAVDGSQNMLNTLRIRLEKNNIGNVRPICSNVLKLCDIADNTADCVYFFGLIEHIIDLEEFTKEIKRILKPNGVVIGITPNGLSPWYVLRKLVRGTGKHCSSDVYHTENSLDSIFLTTGFFKEAMHYWGGVPAGVGDFFAKVLIMSEKILTITPLKRWLGGITFAYRKGSA